MPKLPIRLAINYALNHWRALMNYYRDGILNIDNNTAERVIESQCQNPIAILSMTFSDEQWHQVEKDELTYLQKSALRKYSPYISFKTTELPGEYLNILQQGLSQYLYSGVPFVDNLINSQTSLL